MILFKKLILVLVIIVVILLFAFYALRYYHGTDSIIVSTAWVISDPLYRENSEFEFQEYRLGQAMEYDTDISDASADAHDVKLPKFIVFRELDSKGKVVTVLGYDSLEFPRKYKVFVRKEDNLVKLYESEYISICSVSPDMKYVAINEADDVVMVNVDDGTSFSCGITNPLEGVMPCWYSNKELLISVEWDKIIKYDIDSKSSSVVLEGKSPVKWRDRVVFQRFAPPLYERNCQFYVVDKIGSKEELLFEMKYISGPISISPDGSYLCCEATYQHLQKDFNYKLYPGRSLYIRNMNDGTYTFYTDNPPYSCYWTWEKTEEGIDAFDSEDLLLDNDRL